MATVVYDDYGRTSDDPDFGSRSETPEPYIVDAAGASSISALPILRRVVCGESPKPTAPPQLNSPSAIGRIAQT